MAGRDRAEARPFMNAIASSPHLPPVSRATHNEVTPATFQEFPILRLFVPTRAMQHGAVGGALAGLRFELSPFPLPKKCQSEGGTVPPSSPRNVYDY